MSWNYSLNEKLRDPTVDDLIDVVDDQFRNWLFEPVRRLLSEPRFEVPAFNLLLTYFEGIWQYVTCTDSRNRTREFFVQGFVDALKRPGRRRETLEKVGEVLFRDARCGVFHSAMPRGRILLQVLPGDSLSVTFPRGPDGEVDQGGKIGSVVVNTHGLLIDVENHFERFIARLRDKSNEHGRRDFKAFCEHTWDIHGAPNVAAEDRLLQSR